MTTAIPTPAALAAAGFVALPNNAVVTHDNGWGLHTYDGTKFVTVPIGGSSFPLDTQLYVVPNWASKRTPPVITPPPASGYASGISIPASIPGFTRHYTDFTKGIDTTFWTGKYSGHPGGTNGLFMPSHVDVVNNVLTIAAYQDPSANNPASNNWGGGGIQTQTRWPVGTQFYSVVRKDTYSQWYAIQLLMGNNWPPEDDYEETSSSDSDTESIHYGANNQQVQAQKSGLDLTDWGLWVHTWTTTGITTDLTVKGVTTRVASMNLPDTNASDPNSDVQPMFYSFQLQTEGGTSPTDPAVTAATPVKFQLEQFAAFTPA